MAKQQLDSKVQAVEALRLAPKGPEVEKALAKALADRNNYLAGKAAAVVADLGIQTLIPNLLAAFDRFFEKPADTDPKCWAKEAIARALASLAYTDPAPFLRGIVHRQMEPVWGGQADSAATLRGICALALAHTTLPRTAVLGHLVERVADEDKTVRVDAIRSLAQFPVPEGVLLIRMKALVGDAEPEVTGQCLTELLDFAPEEYTPFVVRFADHPTDELQFEAVSALGTSRHKIAMDALIAMVRDKPMPLAKAALAALARSRMREDLRNQVQEAVQDRQSSSITEAFRKEFGQRPS